MRSSQPRRHALQRHNGARAGVFSDLGMLGGDDVHNDTALEHLGEAFLYSECTGLLFHAISPEGERSVIVPCGPSRDRDPGMLPF